METMGDFVDKIKQRYDISSDYGLAKVLGLTRQTMSSHRTGRAKHFSEETACRIAALLDVDPAYVMACLAAERAKSEDVREAWKRVSKIMRSAPLVIALSITSIFVPPQNAHASGAHYISHNSNVLHIMRRRIRDKWRACLLSRFWCRLITT